MSMLCVAGAKSGWLCCAEQEHWVPFLHSCSPGTASHRAANLGSNKLFADKSRAHV